jgi:hypothetical protein
MAIADQIIHYFKLRMFPIQEIKERSNGSQAVVFRVGHFAASTAS